LVRFAIDPEALCAALTDSPCKFSTINAKAEAAAGLPTYRDSFRRKRCIVSADGFYEPDKIHHKKQPCPWRYFRLTDQPLFGFAGLYDLWTDQQTGKEIWSYTVESMCGHSRSGMALPAPSLHGLLTCGKRPL
jgi:putative SOS response-associated peptidase YedK